MHNCVYTGEDFYRFVTIVQTPGLKLGFKSKF